MLAWADRHHELTIGQGYESGILRENVTKKYPIFSLQVLQYRQSNNNDLRKSTAASHDNNSLGIFALLGLRCPQALDVGSIEGEQASQFARHSSHLRFPRSDPFQRVLCRSRLWFGFHVYTTRWFQPLSIACLSGHTEIVWKRLFTTHRSRRTLAWEVPSENSPDPATTCPDVGHRLFCLFRNTVVTPSKGLGILRNCELCVPRRIYTPKVHDNAVARKTGLRV